MLGLTSDHSLIEVPAPEDRGAREAPRRLLNQILEARAEELFRLVRRELVASRNGSCPDGRHRPGRRRSASVGDVRHGGTSPELPGAKWFGPGDCGLAGSDRRSVWTTAAGLMMYSAKLKVREEAQQRAAGFLEGC